MRSVFQIRGCSKSNQVIDVCNRLYVTDGTQQAKCLPGRYRIMLVMPWSLGEREGQQTEEIHGLKEIDRAWDYRIRVLWIG
jgi:hypothetical protein